MNDTLQAMMKSLVSVCDGASSRDSAGFSAADVWNGNYLAGTPADDWTDEDAEVAAFLAGYYHKQLTAMGFPAPEARGSEDRPVAAWADVRERAREKRQEEYRAARKAWEEARQKEAAQPAVLTFDQDARQFILTGPYNAARVAAVKAVPGRRYSSEPKPHDRFPLTSIGALLALCLDHGVVVDVDPDQIVTLTDEAARVEAEKNARPQVTRAAPGLLALTFEYNAGLVQRVKRDLAGYRPRYAPNPAPHWTVEATGDHLEGVLHICESELRLRVDPALWEEATAWEDGREAREAGREEDLAQSRALAGALTAEPLPTPGVTTTLMPHQYVPLHAIRRRAALLLADAPGLGKTLESIAILAAHRPARTLIVCPSNLCGNWVAEFAAHAPGVFQVQVLEGEATYDPNPEADVLVIGWATVASWQDALGEWAPGALILDEAHYGKSGTARARGAAALALAQGVRARSGLTLLLTGTPIVNRPLELLPLLDMLGILSDFGGEWEFKERYCGPEERHIGYGQYRTTYTGATNTAELNALLVDSGCYVRRTKKMLVEGGQMGRKIINGADAYDHAAPRHPLRVDLTGEARDTYRRAVVQFQEFVAELARQEAELDGAEVTDEYIEKIVKRKSGLILPKIGLVRQVLAGLKLPYVFRHVDALRDAGEQVVVVAHHRDTVDAIAGRYTGLKIQGGMRVAKVEEVKRVFNTAQADTHPVLVLAIESGKTGHTLCLQRKNGAGQECARMVIAEEGYVPGDEEQAQDRLWRIGQSRDVQVVNLIARGTLDEGLFALRESKRHALTSVMDGEGDVDTTGAVSFLTGYLMSDTLAAPALL